MAQIGVRGDIVAIRMEARRILGCQRLDQSHAGPRASRRAHGFRRVQRPAVLARVLRAHQLASRGEVRRAGLRPDVELREMALQRSLLGRIAAGPRKQCERTVERQIGPLGKRTRRMLASFSVPTRVERTRKIAEQQCGLQPVDPVGEIDRFAGRPSCGGNTS